MQLLQVRKILNPVNPVNVVQAKVNRRNIGHVLLIDAEEFARVVQPTLHGASLAVVYIVVLLIALSNGC